MRFNDIEIIRYKLKILLIIHLNYFEKWVELEKNKGYP